MHVVLDISSLPYGTGVSVYTRELVLGLNEVGQGNKITLLAGALKQAEFFKKWFKEANLKENFELKIIPIPPKVQTKLWTEFNFFTPEFWVKNADIYHSLDWSLGLGKKKTMLTVHDLFFWKHPELQKHPFENQLKTRILKAKEHNCRIIAVSNSTKADLIELTDYQENLIDVVYEAAPKYWKSINNLESQKIVKKYNLPKQYLLAVSTQEPRKNYSRLIKAYWESKVDMELVLVGKVGWGDDLECSGKVRKLGFVPDEDLVAIWQNAIALLYPSLHEGFGLPILQSFKLGIPVVTSNLSSMKEIAQGRAIIVDPYNTNSITEGIVELVKMDRNERNRLIESAKLAEKNFNWENTAKETLEVYEKVIKGM